MMRVQYNLSLLFSSLLLISPTLFATSVISTAPGGDSTTGYQATARTFADGDKIRGHAMFKAGFTIPASGTVTWDGDGIVNGPITFSHLDSVLNLTTDLRLGSTASLIGNVSTWPHYCNIIGNGNTIFLGGSLTMAVGTLFSTMGENNLVIDGQGHTFNCPNSFAMGTTGSITLKNMLFNVYDYYNNGGIINGGDLILENITITGGKTSLTDWTSLANQARSVAIRGRIAVNMPGRRFKLNCNTLGVNIIIEKNSTLYIGKGTILEAIKSTDSGSITFTMADETSVLHLDGCDFYTGANGLSLTKGTVIFENKVRIFNKNYDGASNADMTKALIFGDGTAAGDVNVRVLGGAYVTVDGCIKDNHS